MKGVVLTGIRQVMIADIPVPAIQQPTDVLLKVVRVGICGSDVHYYAQGRIGNQVVQYPYRVGHECSGVVEQIGERVRGVKPGDLVAVDPLVSCGHCEQCRRRRFNTCLNQRFLGCPGQMEGCLCEYIVMPDACCYPVGPELSAEEAALAEPLAVGLYAVRSAVPLRGKKIAILGAGAIGLSVLLTARLDEPAAVYVTDKLDYRLAAARRQGACWAGNPDRIDIVKDLQTQEPMLLDVVFQCCGEQEALDQAVELLKPGGHLMIVGIPEADRVSLAIHSLRRKELTLVNVRRQNECEQATIDLMREGRLQPQFLLTHRFPLEEAARAFDLVDRYQDGVLRAMVEVASP